MKATKLNDAAQLLNALELMKTQEKKYLIEYTNGEQASPMTGIRIGVLSTPAGVQYGIWQVNIFGQQGSGWYTFESANIMAYATKLENSHDRATYINQHKFNPGFTRNKPKCSWYLFELEENEYFQLTPRI